MLVSSGCSPRRAWRTMDYRQRERSACATLADLHEADDPPVQTDCAVGHLGHAGLGNLTPWVASPPRDANLTSSPPPPRCGKPALRPGPRTVPPPHLAQPLIGRLAWLRACQNTLMTDSGIFFDRAPWLKGVQAQSAKRRGYRDHVGGLQHRPAKCGTVSRKRRRMPARGRLGPLHYAPCPRTHRHVLGRTELLGRYPRAPAGW